MIFDSLKKDTDQTQEKVNKILQKPYHEKKELSLDFNPKLKAEDYRLAQNSLFLLNREGFQIVDVNIEKRAHKDKTLSNLLYAQNKIEGNKQQNNPKLYNTIKSIVKFDKPVDNKNMKSDDNQVESISKRTVNTDVPRIVPSLETEIPSFRDSISSKKMNETKEKIKVLSTQVENSINSISKFKTVKSFSEKVEEINIRPSPSKPRPGVSNNREKKDLTILEKLRLQNMRNTSTHQPKKSVSFKQDTEEDAKKMTRKESTRGVSLNDS